MSETQEQPPVEVPPEPATPAPVQEPVTPAEPPEDNKAY